MMHVHRLLGVVSASCLLCLPAVAQTSLELQVSERATGQGTQAMMFLRIPLGASPQGERGPRLGFGLFAGCGTSLSMTSERNREACDAIPVRSLEFSTGFNNEPWALSFGSAGRRIDFINLSPQTGALYLAEDAGSNNWLWLGPGAVAVVSVAVALSGSSDTTVCPDGFVATPLGDGCQPIS
jgi:hypothetical protein